MRTTKRETGADGTPWRHISLARLIDAGLVRLPLVLEHAFRGGPIVTARVEALDRVVFDGQPYDSLSTAGGMARKSVRGSPPGRPYPQTNGWTFWQVRRPDGSMVMLDALRRELHEGNVVRIDDARRQGT